MRIPIHAPDAPPHEPMRLGEWSIEVGEFVEVGDALAELIAAGYTIDLVAPAAGILRKVLRQPDQSVSSGDILGWIESEQT
jgi:pyruvate/2-oxoglutarate dehydrogenase complex dihydrolipoamide acyltransferase (E2) component